MRDKLAKLLAVLDRSALGGAWLFAVGTLCGLVWFISQGWPGSGRTTIVSTSVGENRYHGIGLTYTGMPGTILLWSEALVLLAAIVLSVLPRTPLRRIGHGLLIAWSALWVANFVWLTVVGGTWMLLWTIWPILLGVLFLCTLYRAARGWRARPSGHGQPVPATA